MTAPPMAMAPAQTRRQMYENIRLMMETERSSFITLWRMINNYILPTRGRFQTTDRNRGDRFSRDILDTSGTLAARTCGSGMSSGITNQARPWFRLTSADPSLLERDSVKEWLYTVTERMRWVLSRSNFYNKCPVVFSDIASFGTAAIMEIEDEHNVVRFVDYPIGSFAVSNGPDGKPAVVTRAFQMTVRQLVTEFGFANCSKAVQDNWEKGSNTEAWYDVVHIIMKNDNYMANSLKGSENKPWISCYYEIGAPLRGGDRGVMDKFLREEGFYEMPVFVPVWSTTGEDVYGTDSPGITALPDVRQLQSMERRGLQALEKMVNPPMTGPTSMMSVPASILPGTITYVDTREGQQGFRAAHEVQLRLDALEAKEGGIRQRIERAFFVDLFLMIQFMDAQRAGKQPVTAAEIYERQQEKLLALGPVLEQLNQRFLDPVIHRTFAIMARRGFIPPMPPDLHGSTLKVEYISMMHQAQKAAQLGGYNNLISTVTNLAQLDKTAVDKIDVDKIIEHINESSGNPPDIVRSADVVSTLRRKRAQAEVAAQRSQQLAQEAAAAKNLSNTDVQKPSALSQMIQNQNLPGSPVEGPENG